MFSVVYIICRDMEEANSIASALVAEKLVACANFNVVSSVYRWAGRIEQDTEVAILCKTTTERVPAVIKQSKGIAQLRAALHYVLEAGRRLWSLSGLGEEGNRERAMRRKTAEMGPRREVVYEPGAWERLKELRERASVVLTALKAKDIDATVFGSVARGRRQADERRGHFYS